ncbi:MAG: hypothetical protein JSS82_13895 [Bacteroidetes bacterium]|nr:hypothetical protein [Bacteroidota bacterium]
MWCTVPAYYLPENYGWSVADACTMIGAFVLMCILIGIAGGIDYWLTRKEVRSKGVIAVMMHYAHTPFAVIAAYDPNDPKGFQQSALDILDGYPGDPLPPDVEMMYENYEVYFKFNTRFYNERTRTVSWDAFSNFAGGKQLSYDEDTYTEFSNYMDNVF